MSDESGEATEKPAKVYESVQGLTPEQINADRALITETITDCKGLLEAGIDEVTLKTDVLLPMLRKLKVKHDFVKTDRPNNPRAVEKIISCLRKGETIEASLHCVFAGVFLTAMPDEVEAPSPVDDSSPQAEEPTDSNPDPTSDPLDQPQGEPVSEPGTADSDVDDEVVAEQLPAVAYTDEAAEAAAYREGWIVFLETLLAGQRFNDAGHFVRHESGAVLYRPHAGNLVLRTSKSGKRFLNYLSIFGWDESAGYFIPDEYDDIDRDDRDALLALLEELCTDGRGRAIDAYMVSREVKGFRRELFECATHIFGADNHYALNSVVRMLLDGKHSVRELAAMPIAEIRALDPLDTAPPPRAPRPERVRPERAPKPVMAPKPVPKPAAEAEPAPEPEREEELVPVEADTEPEAVAAAPVPISIFGGRPAATEAALMLDAGDAFWETLGAPMAEPSATDLGINVDVDPDEPPAFLEDDDDDEDDDLMPDFVNDAASVAGDVDDDEAEVADAPDVMVANVALLVRTVVSDALTEFGEKLATSLDALVGIENVDEDIFASSVLEFLGVSA